MSKKPDELLELTGVSSFGRLAGKIFTISVFAFLPAAAAAVGITHLVNLFT